MPDSPSEPPETPTWRTWAIRIGRIALAVGPLYWVAGRLDWSEMGQRVGRLTASTLLLAFTMPLVAMGVGAVRWRVLLRAYGARTLPPLVTLYRHVLVGFYFNLLPGAIAGDAYRAVRTRDVLEGTVNSFTVVVAERICGFIGLMMLATAALVTTTTGDEGVTGQALALGAALALVLAVAAFAAPAVYRRWVSAPERSGLLAVADRLVRKVPPPQSVGGIATAIVLSLGTQAIAMLLVLVLVWDLSPEASSAEVLQVLPLLLFLTYIPITPGAVGQRELVFVHLLGLAGVAAESAVTASLAVLAMYSLSAVAGGLVYLLEGSSNARSGVEQPSAPE